jgi:hypothetical protein
MKYLLLVLVSLAASDVASAMTTDSMLGPFKLPFTIGVNVNGRFQGSAGAGAYPHPESFGDIDTIRAIGTQTHVHQMNSLGWHGVDTSMAFVIGDTIRYQYWSIDTSQGNSELIFSNVQKGFDITFDTILHLVPTVHIWSFSGEGGQHENIGDRTTWSVNLSNFTYNADSIFTGTATLKEHLDTLNFYESGATANDPIYFYFITLDSLATVDLSGIFTPTTLARSWVMTEGTSSDMSIYEWNGSLVCSFDAEMRSRSLEVFSLLGQRVLAMPIAAGEEHATMKLPNGLYFVRLGNKVVKVQIN